MVRTTEYLRNGRRPLARTARFARRLVLLGLAGAVLVAVSGCSGGSTGASTGSATSSPTVGAHMAGPAADVYVTQAAVDAKPKAVNLKTPEAAVRSYLDWTTYAYRIGQSAFAAPTMSSYEGVHVDSYIQYNIEKSRLIDQTLTSITFGKPSVAGTRTLVPTVEAWTYSYLSTASGNKVLGGPFTAAYDTTYTVVKSPNGGWVVDSVDAKPKDTVK